MQIEQITLVRRPGGRPVPEDFALNRAELAEPAADNVGGAVQAIVPEQLAVGARVVLCGLAAQHNGEAASGLSAAALINARATVRGMVVYDHEHAWPSMQAEPGALLRSGELAFREDVSAGLPSAPAAFARLMRVQNQGKALVRL